MVEKHIETIARGICEKDGFVLICRGKNAGNLYFPGGHIEFGETGAYALEREILEEMGLESHATRFIGCCEHRFVQDGSGEHAEINLVYAVDVPEASPGEPAPSCEDWIDFFWMPVSELAASAVEPAVLRDVALDWLRRDEKGVGRIASTATLRRA